MIWEQIIKEDILSIFTLDSILAHSLMNIFSYNLNLYLNEHRKTYYYLCNIEWYLRHKSFQSFDLINEENIIKYNMIAN